MAYRSSEAGITSLLEEQRELQALERQTRARKVRAALTVVAALGVLVGATCVIASQPPPARYVCHESRREHEVFTYQGGTIRRPADTWTTCAWR